MEPWRATVLTLFPDMFPGPLAYSLAGKALSARVWELETMDIRGFTSDKHAAVDDAPFGGGPGLVMRADVVDAALTGIGLSQPEGEVVAADMAEPPRPLIYLTPRGARLTQARVRELADGPGVVVLCGRYEGIDQRAVEAWRMEELSVGDFVLSGGEPAAIILIDACVRLLDGVMGSEESPREESFEGGLLEYPHYTRPRSWRDREVPEVLVSGDHAKVRAWRRAEAERITKERRPDLWSAYETAKDRAEDRGSEK